MSPLYPFRVIPWTVGYFPNCGFRLLTNAINILKRQQVSVNLSWFIVSTRFLYLVFFLCLFLSQHTVLTWKFSTAHVSPQEERINKTVVKTTAGNMHEVNPLRSMKIFCKQKGPLALVNIITQEKKANSIYLR